MCKQKADNNMPDKLLQDKEIEWLNTYANKVKCVFSTRFEIASDRFKSSYPLLNRFTSAIDAVKTNGRSLFSAVDEAHNELCIAYAILENQEPQFYCLEYEPQLNNCAKSIDFLATSDDLKVYIDVKTIKPLVTDRWEHYEENKAKKERFPRHVNIILEKDCLGGELWHNMFAARGRILEHSLELENKIAEGNLLGEKTLFVLALCGEEFYWHQDELEDFVSYYYSGIHRDDDPFSKMEAWDIKNKHIAISKTISRFACMSRTQGDILHKRLNWNVQPPHHPHF